MTLIVFHVENVNALVAAAAALVLPVESVKAKVSLLGDRRLYYNGPFSIEDDVLFFSSGSECAAAVDQGALRGGGGLGRGAEES